MLTLFTTLSCFNWKEFCIMKITTADSYGTFSMLPGAVLSQDFHLILLTTREGRVLLLSNSEHEIGASGGQAHCSSHQSW